MRINRDFAPITIVLESMDDKEVFLNILEAAYRKRTEGYFYSPFSHKPEDTLCRKINFIREQLK